MSPMSKQLSLGNNYSIWSSSGSQVYLHTNGIAISFSGSAGYANYNMRDKEITYHIAHVILLYSEVLGFGSLTGHLSSM